MFLKRIFEWTGIEGCMVEGCMVIIKALKEIIH